MDRRLGRPLPHQLANPTRAHPSPINLSLTTNDEAYTVLIQVSLGYSVEMGRFPRVTHPSAARTEVRARLACVKPAASVRSEPGSNSQVETSIFTRSRIVLSQSNGQNPPNQPESTEPHDRPTPKRRQTNVMALNVTDQSNPKSHPTPDQAKAKPNAKRNQSIAAHVSLSRQYVNVKERT